MKKVVSQITADFLDDRTRIISLVWNKADAKEVERARRRFAEYLEKGWIAFVETADGRKTRVYKFDPKSEKIILARLVEGG